MTRILCLMLLALPTIAMSQQASDTIPLQPLVVTATRTPTAVNRVPASVTIFDGEQLRRSGVRTVDEALRMVSGATIVQTGSYGAGTALFLRGGESDYVQLLIDGVQINSPGEQINWSNVAVENIERIEVVKGPSSVLYGSDAVTGVVHLITKQGVGRTRGEVSVVGGRGEKVGTGSNGAFGNGSFQANLQGGSTRASYSLGLSHFTTDGAYAFNNSHRNSSATANLVVRPDQQTMLKGLVRLGGSRFHYPTSGTGQLTDRNQYRESQAVALGLDATRSLSSALDAAVSFRHNQNDDTNDDQSDTAADTVGFYRFHSEDRFRRQDADLRLNYRFNPALLLTVGTELEWQSNRGSSESPFGASPPNTESRNNRALYAQWLGDYSRVAMQLGVRAEDNEKFGNFTTYRGGLSVQLTPALRARASAGTAFKEPRFYEQFAEGFVKGNPDLQPEQSRSIEAGVDAAFGRVTVSAVYFNQKFKDLIQYVGLPANPSDPNYLNVAGARAAGLELESVLQLRPFTVKGSYTYLETSVTDAGDGSDPTFQKDEQLIRRPRHSAALALTAEAGRTTFGTTATYVGRRADLDFSSFPANRVELDLYVRVDAYVQHKLTRNAHLLLRMENALFGSYEEVYNFPARGNVVYGGVTLAF